MRLLPFRSLGTSCLQRTFNSGFLLPHYLTEIHAECCNSIKKDLVNLQNVLGMDIEQTPSVSNNMVSATAAVSSVLTTASNVSNVVSQHDSIVWRKH